MTSQGPFTFDDNSTGCRAIKDAEGEDIAHTVGLADDDEDRANAALLSAADDMLRALKQIAIQFPDPGEDEGEIYVGPQTLAQIRAAIAKAERRS
jgi:hypothetical protein